MAAKDLPKEIRMFPLQREHQNGQSLNAEVGASLLTCDKI
jgi:hypothetical protein